MPHAKLMLEVSVRAACATVILGGEVDIAAAQDLEERASLLLHQPIDRLTLDMGEVSFIDSFGLAALVRISQRATAVDCTVALVNVSPFVRRVLDVTGLAPLLNPEVPTAPPGPCAEARSPLGDEETGN